LSENNRIYSLFSVSFKEMSSAEAEVSSRTDGRRLPELPEGQLSTTVRRK